MFLCYGKQKEILSQFNAPLSLMQLNNITNQILTEYIGKKISCLKIHQQISIKNTESLVGRRNDLS